MAKVIDTAAIQPVKASPWPKIFAFLKAAPLIPLSIIVVFVLAAILADLVTFHDAYQVTLRERHVAAPAFLECAVWCQAAAPVGLESGS